MNATVHGACDHDIASPKALQRREAELPEFRRFALYIPAGLKEKMTVECIDIRPAGLKLLLQGTFGCIVRGEWQVYINADEQAAGPINVRAQLLLHETGLDLPVAGGALFIGREGLLSDVDVPSHLVRRAEELFGTQLHNYGV